MRIRVLVVDDNEDVRASTPFALEAVDHDLEVRAVRGYWEVLDILPRWSPHVVLLDLVMPRSDGSGSTGGAQLLLAMQRFTPGVAVIVHTGKDDAGARRMSMLAGARGYVVKPVGVVELVKAIRAVAPKSR